MLAIPVTAASPTHIVDERDYLEPNQFVYEEPPEPIEGVPESYRPYLEKYDWDVDLAIEVIRYESGGYTQAVNWNDYHGSADCYGSFGLFQIGCLHGGEPLDPKENIAMAYELYKESGWIPWGVCDFKHSCGKLLALIR